MLESLKGKLTEEEFREIYDLARECKGCSTPSPLEKDGCYICRLNKAKQAEIIKLSAKDKFKIKLEKIIKDANGYYTGSMRELEIYFKEAIAEAEKKDK